MRPLVAMPPRVLTRRDTKSRTAPWEAAAGMTFMNHAETGMSATNRAAAG